MNTQISNTAKPQPTCSCGHPLHVYEMMGKTYAECKNRACRRVDVTLQIDVLMSMSNADLDAKGYPDYSDKTASAA